MIINNTPYQHLLDRILGLLSPGHKAWLDRVTVIISMESSLRTTGGLAERRRSANDTYVCFVKLNESLFMKLDDAGRYEILSHEFAHAVFMAAGLNVGHSEAWVMLHKSLGGTGARTHHCEVDRNLRSRAILIDSKGNWMALTMQKWNKVKHHVLGGLCDAKLVGMAKLNLNTMEYRWERLAMPEKRDMLLFKGKLRLVA